MNLTELKKKLIDEKFNKFIYGVDVLPNFEGYCIMSESNGFKVFYYERGEEFRVKTFDNEEDACLFFYKEISSDPIAKK